MKIQQKKFSRSGNWETLDDSRFTNENCDIVFAFGDTDMMEDGSLYCQICEMYPAAAVVMNSTAGEIYDSRVYEGSVSLTAISFEKTTIKTASVKVGKSGDGRKAGQYLASVIPGIDLKNVLVIADGQYVDGAKLVEGLHEGLPAGTLITGGLAADGTRFRKTLVGLNEVPTEGMVVAIGFYGDALQVGHGCQAGLDSFGPERFITRSKDNIVFELDGKPALDVYQLYLGEYADKLPLSGFYFPLGIREENSTETVMRTLLAINEKDRSLVFAGNMPERSYARMMKANTDRLIEGASDAAFSSINGIDTNPELAIVISCVARKMVLNGRTGEEVEEVRARLGMGTAITGFYSYGEISPSFNMQNCRLHNQTMTITTLSEQ